MRRKEARGSETCPRLVKGFSKIRGYHSWSPSYNDNESGSEYVGVYIGVPLLLETATSGALPEQLCDGRRSLMLDCQREFPHGNAAAQEFSPSFFWEWGLPFSS